MKNTPFWLLQLAINFSLWLIITKSFFYTSWFSIDFHVLCKASQGQIRTYSIIHKGATFSECVFFYSYTSIPPNDYLLINLNSFRVVCLWMNGWHKIDYSWINCHNVKHLAQWAHWQGWYRQRSECRMSRKWILNQPELENCLGYLSAFILSVCVFLCVSVSPSFFLCVYLFAFVSVSLPV